MSPEKLPGEKLQEKAKLKVPPEKSPRETQTAKAPRKKQNCKCSQENQNCKCFLKKSKLQSHSGNAKLHCQSESAKLHRQTALSKLHCICVGQFFELLRNMYVGNFLKVPVMHVCLHMHVPLYILEHAKFHILYV